MYQLQLHHVIIRNFRVAEYEQDNKMTKINLASIFGPVLMNPEKVKYFFFQNVCRMNDS